jgi:peptide-methionine (S)-S-oxide reductase
VVQDAFRWSTEEQRERAEEPRPVYPVRRSGGRFGSITTEILPASGFCHTEAYHQQVLAKNPAGTCGHGKSPRRKSP